MRHKIQDQVAHEIRRGCSWPVESHLLGIKLEGQGPHKYVFWFDIFVPGVRALNHWNNPNHLGTPETDQIKVLLGTQDEDWCTGNPHKEWF